MKRKIGMPIAVSMESKRFSIPRPPQDAATEQCFVYQFKITLLHITPPIWRRIQVPDGTLDELHEHIQTAMGWTNSHLHDFLIGDRRYGDPELLDEDWGERDFLDSTEIHLSQLLATKPASSASSMTMTSAIAGGTKSSMKATSLAEPDGRHLRCVDGARLSAG